MSSGVDSVWIGASIIVSGTDENPVIFDGIGLAVFNESLSERPVVDIDYARFITNRCYSIDIDDGSDYDRFYTAFQYIRIRNSLFDRQVRIATAGSELFVSNNRFEGYEAEIKGTYLAVTDNVFVGLNILNIFAVDAPDNDGECAAAGLVSKNAIGGVSRVSIAALSVSCFWAYINPMQITNNMIAGASLVSLGVPSQPALVQYNNFFGITRTNSMRIVGVASNNYWGTTDSSVIDALIRDRWDSLDVPYYVNYLPILTDPDPDPATPIAIVP